MRLHRILRESESRGGSQLCAQIVRKGGLDAFDDLVSAACGDR